MPIRLGLGITLDRSQSLYGTGTAAGRLLGSEPAGFAIDFAQDSALIRWPSSPASQYSGNIAGLISAGVLTFSRASTATYFDANGVMQTASNDVLRRTYDPSTKAALGYLPEPQRTNRALQSSSLGTTWNAVNATISSDAAVGIDGTMSMDKIAESTASGNHRVDQSVTLSSGANALSAVVMAAERTKGRLHIDGVISSVSSGVDLDFDLTAVSVSASASGNITSPAGSIKSLGGGRYLVIVTFTCSASAASAAIRLYNRDASGAISYAGTSGSGLYWGAVQLEDGSYTTSHIPTTSSTVTRAADVMSADLSKLPFSSSVGSLIAIAQPSPDTATNGFGLAQLDDGSDNNRIGLTNGTAGSKIARATVVNSGSADADISSASNAAASRFKQALAWAANDIEMVVAGVASTKDTSCAVPSGLTTLRIGSKVAASTQWSAPAESLVYIPRRLGQGEMIARTS